MPAPPHAEPNRQATADGADLAQLYRAFLGREAEPAVLASAEPRPLAALAAEMAASDEINECVLHALVQHRPLPHEQLPPATLESLAAWLARRLGCPPLGEAPATPAELLARLFAQPQVGEWLLLAHGSLYTQAMADLALLRKAGRHRLKGKIEFVNREHISGWAIDEAGHLANPQLEIRLKADGRLVAAASAHSYRPDIHQLFGGSGLAGFRAKWEPRQFPFGQALELTLHEASTGTEIGRPYRFENSFVDQLSVAQMLAHEFESIQQRLDALAGMVPQALSYCAFPLEHYRYYRRAHRVPPPPWLAAWQEEARLRRRRAVALGRPAEEPPLPTGPHFTVLLDATALHASATGVRISADSLREQVAWPHWVLHIVGSEGEIPEVAALLGATEARIHHLRSWAEASALLPGTPPERGESPQWIVLLQAGELLDEHALAWMVQALQDEPTANALYWDEDALRHRTGRAPGREPEHVDPILRTPFDPHSMLELNGVGTSFAARADALRAAGALLATAGEAFLSPASREHLAWALHRRGHEQATTLHHVPRFLLTRTDEAIAPGEPEGAERFIATTSPESLRPLLPPAWQHRRWRRTADPIAPGQQKQIVRWQPERPDALISVLIPTRDHWQLVQQCVDSLYDMADRPERLEIIVADNGSTDPATLDYLAREGARERIRVMRIDEPFNWSRLNNQMAEAARGEHLLFLNNDTRMLTRGWDAVLRGELEHPATGAVGARLVYEDMTVQHAGVVFGYENFVGHAHVGQPTTGDGPLPLEPRTTRRASAVTGAFLACRREVFEQVGPFNAAELGVTFNDVEWCVRVTDAGLRVVYAPLIALLHYESKSRGFDFQSLSKQLRADLERHSVVSLGLEQQLRATSSSPALSRWSNDAALQ